MSRKTSAVAMFALVVLLAAAIAGCGSPAPPAGTSTSVPAVTTTAGSSTSSSGPGPVAVDGKQVFADFCSSCHGQDATGGAGPGPDLTKETDLAKVENQVRNGGQKMPPFGGQLSDAQVSAVAQYVLSLNRN